MNSDKHPYFGRMRFADQAWLDQGPQEAALEPDLPIVDAHHHLWPLPKAHAYLLEEFTADIRNSGHTVEATVYVDCFVMYRRDGPEHLKCVGETEFAIGMGAMSRSGSYGPTRVAEAIVGYADLRGGALAAETLDAHQQAANGRFKGVRQSAKWDPDPRVRGSFGNAPPGLLLDEAFNQGFAEVAKRGLVFEASVFHPQISDVVTLARRHENTTIVLNHCGSPVGHSAYADKDEDVYRVWLKDMSALAQCPNVFVKLGGLVIHLANFDYGAASKPPSSELIADLWRPFVEPCVELFGAQRCIAQSNFAVDKAAMSYGTYWNALKRITAGASQEEKGFIYRDTAKRVYQIE